MKKFWSFLNSADGQSAELLLYGDISSETWWGDEVTPKAFADDLKALGDVQSITLRINSGGGDVFAGHAIYNLLRAHKAHVTTIVDGLAGSIASVVALAGDTVVMPKNAMIMVHNPWLWAAGNASELRNLADVLDKVAESIMVVYEAKTGMTRDEVRALMDAETWMTAEDAKGYGFCDEVTDPIQIAASANGRNLMINGICMGERLANVPISFLPTAPTGATEPPAPANATGKAEQEARARKIKLCEARKQ